MSILRFIGIALIFSFLFTGCSPQISQIEYDRKNYELEQLKIRYDLLQQETDGNFNKGTTTTKVSSEVNIADYNALETNYKNLLKQNVALENAYNELREQLDIPTEIRIPNEEIGSEVNTSYETLKENYETLLVKHTALDKSYNTLKERQTAAMEITETEHSIEYDKLQLDYKMLLNQKLALEKDYKSLQQEQQATATTAPGMVPMTTYNELKIEKTDLERRFTILENRYNALNERTSITPSSTIASAEIIEPTELNPNNNIRKGMIEREENSIDLGENIVQSASLNGLFFDFDTYTRTEDFLVLEIAVKNNNQASLKTFWNADKIEITGQNGNTYTSKSFRIGVDYANEKNGTLLKKIDDENTVFARFAFEDLPSNLKHITSLEFVVIIDGEQRQIKFTQLDVSNIELD